MPKARQILLVGGVLAAVFVLILLLAPAQGHPQIALHATLETIAALAELLLAVSILFLWDWSRESREVAWAPCALAAMGILDGLHAATLPGEAFFWLRCLATLVGGLVFAGSALVPAPASLRHRVRLTAGAAVAALILGLAVLVYPPLFPAALVGTEVSTAALGTNVVGSVLFLVASARFARVSTRRADSLLRVLMVQCLLFGAAGPLLWASRLWNPAWWAGHWLHTAADLVALVYGLFAVRAVRETILEQRGRLKKLEDSSVRTMEELSGSERRFEATFKNAAVGLALVGLDGSWLRVNRKLCDIVGYSEEQLLGLTFQDLTHPDDLQSDLAYVRRLLDGEIANYSMEKRYVHRAGHLVWVLITVALARHESGAPEYFISAVEDISARKIAEAELQASNRELESFSYTVAHDLRAPLRAIQGYVRILMGSAAGLAPGERRYFDLIARIAVEAGRQVDGLLEFSRLGRAELMTSDVALDELVREVREDLQRATPGRRVTWTVAALPAVSGDRQLLKVAWTNLLDNALKYTRGREEAAIDVGWAQADDGRVTLFVKDNGVGFDMDHAHKLFGVFQRLHRADEFEGVGIGLATVRRIVERHGGRIWATAAPELGSTFYFTLQQAKVAA